MKSRKKSKTVDIPLDDLYELNVRSFWHAFKQENWSFKWLCLYFVFEYVRPASLYPVLDILPWTQLALLLAVVSALQDRSVRWVSAASNVMMALFFVVVLLSSVFAFHPSSSWHKIDIPVNWLVVYFLIVTVINSRRRFFLFLLVFLLVNFKMSSHGFISFASRGFAYTKWGVVGPPGWFGDSGDFGIAMIVFTAIAIAFVLALRSRWGKYKKLLLYYLPFTGLMTIIGTSSRGAQLGMVAMGAWFLLKSRKGLKALALVAAVGLVLYSALPEEMLQEFESAGEDGTSTDRLAHWAFGMRVIADHPMLGIGYENWLVYCDYMNPDGLGYKDRCRLPHNTYISAGAELGIPGLLLYVLLAMYMFMVNALTRDAAKKNDDSLSYYLAHGFDAGMIGYLVASIFFTVLFYPVFWMQLGMVVALNKVVVSAK